MSNGTDTSDTAPSLMDLNPDDETETNEPAIPHGPRDFPGHPSIISSIARWLFGPDSE